MADRMAILLKIGVIGHRRIPCFESIHVEENARVKTSIFTPANPERSEAHDRTQILPVDLHAFDSATDVLHDSYSMESPSTESQPIHDWPEQLGRPSPG